MSAGEVEAVAALHARALPKDLLPCFGMGFLSAYYRTARDSPHSRVLVAANEAGEILGFVDVSADPAAFARYFVRSHPVLLIGAMARLLIRHPARVVEPLDALLKAKRPACRSGEIQFIAVRREDRSKGVGRRLAAEASLLLERLGIANAHTKTLASNEYAIRMYETHFGAAPYASARIRGRNYTFLSWRTANAGGYRPRDLPSSGQS